MIKLSIIMPVYNVENYIEESINSILQQSYNNWELIIVNDGSVDKTGIICDKYSSNDNRIKVIHKDNTGISDSRNIAIKEATGKYIFFIDGDDYLEKNCLDEFIKCINEEIDIYICSFKRIWNNGKSFIFNRYNNINCNYTLTGQDMLKKMYEKNIYECSVWANIYLREFLVSNNIFFNCNLKRDEDEEWLLKVLLLAKKSKLLDIQIYNTRAGRQNSISSNYKWERNIFKIQISDEILKYCEEIEINDDKLYERICMGMVSFYLNAIAMAYKFNREEKEQILSCAKQYKYILDKAVSKKQKIGSIVVKLFGFNLSSRILSKFNK